MRGSLEFATHLFSILYYLDSHIKGLNLSLILLILAVPFGSGSVLIYKTGLFCLKCIVLLILNLIRNTLSINTTSLIVKLSVCNIYALFLRIPFPFIQ